ncbi:21647_t:CDS:2, partial [Gigaspora margarita]
TEDTIELSADIAISKVKLLNLIDFVYPNLVKNSSNINYIFPEELHIYSSADNMSLIEDSNTEQPQIYSPEFLRSLKISGLPPGELKLKVGIPILLHVTWIQYKGFVIELG